MPTEIRIWQIEDEAPKQVMQQRLDLEARLENWIKNDSSLISPDLLIIGQQVTTIYGGIIDLLAIDTSGNLVVLELKKDKTPRDVVAQVLDYASWVKDLAHEDIESIANSFLKDNTLEQAFNDKFGINLPEVLNERHRLYIIGSILDSSTERIVKYLSETHGVDINVATFNYFKLTDTEFLGRLMLLDENDVQKRAESKSKRKPPKSFEELRAMATDNGIVELYDNALSELKPLFDGINRSQSTIAFTGIFGENKNRNTLLSLFL